MGFNSVFKVLMYKNVITNWSPGQLFQKLYLPSLWFSIRPLHNLPFHKRVVIPSRSKRSRKWELLWEVTALDEPTYENSHNNKTLGHGTQYLNNEISFSPPHHHFLYN